MAIVNRISEQEYQELPLNDEDGFWELWDGVPRQKPGMSMKDADVAFNPGGPIRYRQHFREPLATLAWTPNQEIRVARRRSRWWQSCQDLSESGP